MKCHLRLYKGNWYAVFDCLGERYSATLRTKDEKEAEVRIGLIRDAVFRVENGSLEVPQGVGVRDFVMAGGKTPTEKVRKKQVPLKDLRALYLDSQLSLESNTRGTVGIHLDHFEEILGGRTPIDTIDDAMAQDYVVRRLKQKWKKKPITTRTVAKELATLRTILTWAARTKLIPAKPDWTVKTLSLPKDRARERFRTYDEVVELLAKRAKYKSKSEGDPWESLYLVDKEIRQLLAYVAEKASAPWVHPMVTFVAATGCRRSEMARSLREDWDFDRMRIRIREKKRDKDVEYTVREIEIHPDLAETMKKWFTAHPGGPWTITSDGKKPMRVTTATKALRTVLDVHEKWKRVKGFHVLRHSVASILASKGVDPRVIDDILGHQTEEMRKRYQHLFPGNIKAAVEKIF